MSIALKNLSPSEVIVISRQHPVLAFGTKVGFAIFLATRGYLQSPWRKLPPGPRLLAQDLPLLGNALELRSQQWLTFRKWKKKIGVIHSASDVLTLSESTLSGILDRQPVLLQILQCSWKTNRRSQNAENTDWLDRRAGIYSDRSRNIVVA